MTPQQTNTIKYGTLALAGAFLFYRLFLSDEQGTGATDPTGNGGEDNPGGPVAVFSASRTAELLYDAMKETGTGEEDIQMILRSVTPSQFNQVVQKFGRRSYNKLLGNQINFNPWSELPLEPLHVWLKNELSPEEYNLLRLKYPAHL